MLFQDFYILALQLQLKLHRLPSLVHQLGPELQEHLAVLVSEILQNPVVTPLPIQMHPLALRLLYRFRELLRNYQTYT